MSAIHTAYAMIKMPVPKGVITLKSDQRDALACENAALMHVGRFGEKEAHELAAKMAKTHAGEKEAQELAAKMAKTHGGSTSIRTVVPKPPTGGTPDRLQRRKAHSWAPHQTSLPPINRRTTRRREP
jgi:hypothetical protein